MWVVYYIFTSLNSKITYSSITPLVNSSIAVSGNTNWQTSGNITIPDGYKKYFVRIGVHGAAYYSGIFDTAALNVLSSSTPVQNSVYLDSGNLGQMALYGRVISITAKTNTMAFDYFVYGIN